MEVEQTQAVTGLGLFGNAGGYLGMFLGCALMQFPDLLYTMCNWIVSCNKQKIVRKNDIMRDIDVRINSY